MDRELISPYTGGRLTGGIPMTTEKQLFDTLPPFDWRNDDCIRILGTGLMNDLSTGDIADTISREFNTGWKPGNNSPIVSAMGRDHILSSLLRLFPDDFENFMERYESRGSAAKITTAKESSTAVVVSGYYADDSHLSDEALMVRELNRLERRKGKKPSPTCQWPLGGDATKMCGQKCKGSYCDEHEKQARQGPSPKKEPGYTGRKRTY